MNDELYVSSQQRLNAEKMVTTIGPTLQAMFDAFDQRMKELKPKVIEMVKGFLPYIEILPLVKDQYICSVLASTGFVMTEEPDQHFLTGFINMSKSGEMVITEDDKVEEIIHKAEIDAYIQTYLSDTNYRMTERAINSISAEFQEDLLWKQSLAAYRNDNYALAILGFVALGDRLMSDYSGIVKTGIDKRVTEIIREAESSSVGEKDRGDAYLINTYKAIVRVYDAHVSFDDQEPDELCRHWIMHGRWKKPIIQLDCIKVLHIMFATITRRSKLF